MSTQFRITFNPKGFAEALEGLSGTVEAEATKIAARATSYLTKGSGFHVEMTSMPRYQDSAYGVTRPVAYVVSDDDVTDAEEAENKILSKAVGK